jgi:NAD(P)-dependent dehydrogenase (short-subunit alcohol dehydrogenase family)
VLNAAVIAPLTDVVDVGEDAVHDTFVTAVDASLHLVRSALPLLERSGRGSVVFVGSAVVRHPKPGFGAYNIAKHAALGLSRSLALELGPRGIRVNTLAAAKIGGERLDRYLAERAARLGLPVDDVVAEYVSRIALGRIPAAEEHADAVVFLLSDLARAVTGHTLDTNGGEYFD